VAQLTRAGRGAFGREPVSCSGRDAAAALCAPVEQPPKSVVCDLAAPPGVPPPLPIRCSLLWCAALYRPLAATGGSVPRTASSLLPSASVAELQISFTPSCLESPRQTKSNTKESICAPPPVQRTPTQCRTISRLLVLACGNWPSQFKSVPLISTPVSAKAAWSAVERKVITKSARRATIEALPSTASRHTTVSLEPDSRDIHPVIHLIAVHVPSGVTGRFDLELLLNELRSGRLCGLTASAKTQVEKEQDNLPSRCLH
jgi:hypothetical protein